MKIKQSEQLRSLLDEKYLEFSQASFIEDDPILIPHLFSNKEDIEIAGFLVATIAWGQRKSIIKNAKQMLEIMEHSPSNFIRNHKESDLKKAIGFVHRTFNADDLMYFFTALQQIYQNHGGLEQVFNIESKANTQHKISQFKQVFFSYEHLKRTEKHVADPLKSSSAKRTNMFLRWMVRTNKEGVDFGIWKSIKPKELMLPLDVHTGTVGRKLGLLTRKQNDWKAVEEITSALRYFDPEDPVKYDFSLFGMGVNKLKILNS